MELSMKKGLIVITVMFCMLCTLYAQNRVTKIDNDYFIQNNGQWDKKAKYLTRMNNANIWITDEGITYDFFKLNPQDIDTRERLDKLEEASNPGRQIVSMKFVNHNSEVSFAGAEKLSAYHNYFIGNDETRWAANVPLYRAVEVKEIYSGIDQRFYYDNNYVRYDIIVKPGADPGRISMEFTGADGISIVDNELTIFTKFGDLKNNRLYVYQERAGRRAEIACKFVKDAGGNIGFELGSYDKSAELIIDPLIYAAFLGGSGVEWPFAIKVDKEGNSYITGSTQSRNFPIVNQYQGSQSTGDNCFITKLSADGSSLLFSTYFGGTRGSCAYDLVLDENNNIYICGTGTTMYFPLCNPLPPPYVTSEGEPYLGAFVSVFNSEGNKLLYSTTIGGAVYADIATGIALDKNNDIYVCGQTVTNGLETIGLSYENTDLGIVNAFTAKLVKNGSSYKLGYYTYIPCFSLGNMVIDNNGNAYGVGFSSFKYQDTTVYFKNALGKKSDLLSPNLHVISLGIYKVNDTSGMVFFRDITGDPYKSTNIAAVAINKNNEICLVGYTEDANFPVTEDAYRKKHIGGRDGFITKIDTDGNILYSTFFCAKDFNTVQNFIQGVCFDKFDRTIITGHVYGYVSNGVYVPGPVGMENFVIRFKLGDKEISYSESVPKSSGFYIPLASTVCAQGDNIYVCSHSITSDNLGTPGAYQTEYNNAGEYDIIVLKFDATSCFDVKGQICHSDNTAEGIAGIRVTLTGSDGSMGTAVTNSDGNYIFQKVKENYYTVSFEIESRAYENSFLLLDEDKTIDFNIGNSVSDINDTEYLPTEYTLSQNYPNPFNPSTVIKYQIPEAAQVSLKVYDVMGKEAATLVNSYQARGSYDVTFNANGLSSGIYFYKLNANGKQLINKMLLMK